MRTADQVWKEWESKGVSMKAWADQHGYKPDDVRDVLRGTNLGKRGKGHEIAVRLGLKRGFIGVAPKSYPGLKERGARST